MTDIDETIKLVRTRGKQGLCWASQPREFHDVLAICDAIESTTKALDLLQKHIDCGYCISRQEGSYWLFSMDGEGIACGDTLRDMLADLMRAHK